jgi:hypothetical protein
MNPILAGIIGGAGTGMTNIAGQLDEQRKRDQEERLARDKMAQEQQYRDAMVTLERDKLAEATQAHKDTLAAAYTELEPLVKAGILPESILAGGTTRLQTAATDAAMRQYAEQQKALQVEGRLNMGREAIMNQPARPDVPMPAEGGMYSEAETLPGKAATPKNAMLAAIFGQPGAAEAIEKMYPKPQAIVHAPPGSSFFDPNTNQVVGTVPAAPKDNRMSVKTEVRPDGTYALATDTLTGETTVTKLPGIPGQPQFAPQRPEQPNAAMLYKQTMEAYQRARDTYGEEDPRTKDLATIALGLRDRVDPGTGTRIAPPEKSDPIKDLIRESLGTPRPTPAAPRPAPRPAATPAPATPQPPFPGAIRIVGQDGTPGWLRPGKPMPPGARAVP